MKVFNLSAVHRECGCVFTDRDVYIPGEGYCTEYDVDFCEKHLIGDYDEDIADESLIC